VSKDGRKEEEVEEEEEEEEEVSFPVWFFSPVYVRGRKIKIQLLGNCDSDCNRDCNHLWKYRDCDCNHDYFLGILRLTG